MKKVWIGLIGIMQNDNNSHLQKTAAYVNFLCNASCEEEFINQIQTEAQKSKMEIFEISDVEPFEDRLNNFEVEEYLLKLAKSVELNGINKFGIFHTFNIY